MDAFYCRKCGKEYATVQEAERCAELDTRDMEKKRYAYEVTIPGRRPIIFMQLTAALLWSDVSDYWRIYRQLSRTGIFENNSVKIERKQKK